MCFHRILPFLIALRLICSSTQAMFAHYETRKVPMDRLFTNLQQRLARNTNDFETTYHLARLHAMAYATNLVEIEVQKKDEAPVFAYPGDDSGVPREVHRSPTPPTRQAALQHLTNAIRLYERAIRLLKKSPNMAEHRWLILPVELGHAWCLDQAGRRQDALQTYRRTLKIAWKTEVTGDFELKQWVQDAWNDVRVRRNPIRSRRRGYIGPGVCFSQEVIGYLLKLLDPAKDAKEIARLKKDQQTLQSMGLGRAITPILVPLEMDVALSDLVSPNAKVRFDLDGSGLPRQWGWITPKAAWLVFDLNGCGRITSALQMFGNVTFWVFWRNGYDALAALDDDRDGILRGPELRGLALWHDQNCDGVSDPGEVRPVAGFGITAIACAMETHPTGIPWNPAGVTFAEGKSRPTYDWFAPSAAIAAVAEDTYRRDRVTGGRKSRRKAAYGRPPLVERWIRLSTETLRR